MIKIIEQYNEGDVSVKVDCTEDAIYITTEIPTHDGKYMLLGANDYISGTYEEAQFEMWIVDRSYINDELITDFESSCYDIFDCCDFVNSDDPEKELKELAEAETLQYFDDLKTSIHSMLGAMEKHFDLTDDELDEDEQPEFNFNVFG